MQRRENARIDLPPVQNRCHRLRPSLLGSRMKLWFDPHVLLNKQKKVFFSLRDGNIGILADTVQKNHGVENVAAKKTMPPVERTVWAIKLFKTHPPPAFMALHFEGPFIHSALEVHLILPFDSFLKLGDCSFFEIHLKDSQMLAWP